MARNTVLLSQIVGDFILTQEEGDYSSNSSQIAIHNFALRGLREIGFDLGKKVKSLKLSIDTSTDSVALPDDFVDLIKIGIVDADGIVRVFGNNKNINYSRKIADPVTNTVFDGNPLNIPANQIDDRAADKTATDNTSGSDNDFGQYVFENYIYQGGAGRLYGAGGGHLAGEYRLNLDEDRIEIETNSGFSQVVIEYIADEARSSDPEVHVYAEEALRAYIYYKIIERKSSVPSNEKIRARAEYYNERRKANARLSNFTKEEALKTIRKNFMQAPKY